MSRHTTSHGVDGVLDISTVSSELVSQLLDLLLRLCKSHTVARHDDDALSATEHTGSL